MKDPLVKVSEKIAEKFQWLFDLKDSVGGFVAKVIHRGRSYSPQEKPIKKDSKEKKLVPNQLLITFLLNLHQIII